MSKPSLVAYHGLHLISTAAANPIALSSPPEPLYRLAAVLAAALAALLLLATSL